MTNLCAFVPSDYTTITVRKDGEEVAYAPLPTQIPRGSVPTHAIVWALSQMGYRPAGDWFRPRDVPGGTEFDVTEVPS